MPGINGIFEPFKKYVRNQLNKRQEIVKDRKEGEFYTYTTAKSCYLRMVSGVNIAHKNNILESSETPHKLDEGLAKQYILEGGTLYYDRLEEGAMRESFTEGKAESKTRGFTYGDDHVRADAGDNFGIVPMPGIVDAEIRTKTPEGSLREAKINFECHNRRQLQVLEALYMRPGYLVLLEWGWSPYIHSKDGIETDPSSGIARKFLDPTKVQDTTGNLFNKLNREIIKKKQDTEGNYDGFIGIVKNFNYTSRDDGGFSCTTELIAQGEILESLRSTKKFMKTEQFEIARTEGLNTENTKFLGNYTNTSGDIGRLVEVTSVKNSEILDKFMLYIKSIKAFWDRTGDEGYLQIHNTKSEKREERTTAGQGRSIYSYTYQVDAIDYKSLNEISPEFEEAFMEIDKMITDVGKFSTNEGQDQIDINNPQLTTADTQTYGWVECKRRMNVTPPKPAYYGPNNFYSHWNYSHTEAIWEACKGPGDGGRQRWDYEIVGETRDFDDETDITPGKYDPISSAVSIEQLNRENPDPFVYPGPDGYPEGRLFKWTGLEEATNDFDKDTTFNKPDNGITAFYNGLIVQQIAKYVSSDPEVNSGYRKNIFVRWDLICQIFNHLSVNKLITDNGEEPIAEMTYLAPKQQTYDLSSDNKIDNTDQGKGANKNSLKEYIKYQPPALRPTIPGEMYYNDQDKNYTKNSTGHSIIGGSLNEQVCLMPHQHIVSHLYTGNKPEQIYEIIDFDETDDLAPVFLYNEVKGVSQPFTSYKKCDFNGRSIGGVLFNIDFLIAEYERIATTKLESTQLQRAKPTINFNKYFNAIWEGVNTATGNYYDFGLHIEHERPHVGRIIDFDFSGIINQDKLFEFKPQLDGSIVRNFNFNSEIPSDMSSVISIAAQAPNEANDLDSLSFKAFHKDIYSRFSATPLTDEEIKDNQIAAREVLEEEIKNYKELLTSLREYTIMFNNSKFHTINTEEKDKSGKTIVRNPLSADKALSYIEDIEELRISIENKYPLYKTNGKEDHPDAGLSRPDTTYHRSAIIPIKFSAQLDGIAGITPLTLFRIHKDVLPIGYQDKKNSIIFIVKEEKQTITSGQDWTTEFNGQLVLQDSNPNFTGQNLSFGDTETFFNDMDNKIKNLFSRMIDGAEDAILGTISDAKPGSNFQDPIPLSFVTSVGDGFPSRGSGGLHTGIDIRANIGTELHASRDGTIKMKSESCGGGNCVDNLGGFGRYVILSFDEVDEDSQAAIALYAHLSKFNSSLSNGDKVKQGDVIGYVGESGNTTGPHLHYEIGTENYLGSGYPSSSNRINRLTKTYTNSNSKEVHYLLNAEYFTTYY